MRKPAGRVAALAAALTIASVAIAHDGHAPLLTRGATIDPATGVLRLSREARDILDLRTSEVAERPGESRWFAYATIQSPWNSHALVSPQLAGRIVKVHVQPGESVQRGQLLAELDSQELQQLRLELLTAKNKHDLLTDSESRLTSAAKAGAVAGQQVLDAQNQAAQAMNALDVAKRQWLALDLSQERLEAILDGKNEQPLLLPVRSPIDGSVAHADLSLGKIVDPKEHVFEVVDLRTVWLRIQILEKDLSRIQLGQTLSLSLTAHPGRTWTAKIDKLGSALDATTHLAAAWATLTNPTDELSRFMPGMTGQAQLGETHSALRISVPASAVLRDGAERFVLVEQTATKDGSEYK